jgi:hypothetical protein
MRGGAYLNKKGNSYLLLAHHPTMLLGNTMNQLSNPSPISMHQNNPYYQEKIYQQLYNFQTKIITIQALPTSPNSTRKRRRRLKITRVEVIKIYAKKKKRIKHNCICKKKKKRKKEGYY